MKRKVLQAQPYMRGARQPGAALTAMVRGRAPNSINPADIARAAQHIAAADKRRAARGPRATRNQRVPR